jgi:methyl-accepting chemotaxis protein
MENWQVALLTLSALVVGAGIPSLIQLRSTLRRLEVAVQATSERLLPALDDARASLHRIRRITDELEGREADIGELARSAGELARTVDRLRSTTQIASAVAVAVAAGVRAFRETRSNGVEDELDQQQPRRAVAPSAAGSGTGGDGTADPGPA